MMVWIVMAAMLALFWLGFWILYKQQEEIMKCLDRRQEWMEMIEGDLYGDVPPVGAGECVPLVVTGQDGNVVHVGRRG